MIKDRRTDEQKATLTTLVVMHDVAMSGWGQAKDGDSYAAWACKPEDKKRVTWWVVRYKVGGTRSSVFTPRNADWAPPGAHDHLSIYPVHPGHSALKDKED